jgi:hypothetical protein
VQFRKIVEYLSTFLEYKPTFIVCLSIASLRVESAFIFNYKREKVQKQKVVIRSVQRNKKKTPNPISP